MLRHWRLELSAAALNSLCRSTVQLPGSIVMRNFARFALSIGAVALFAGCGALPLSLSKGQGDIPPVAPPGAMPQRTNIIQRLAPASPYRLLYRFRFRHGGNPFAGLINVNGRLYGTTYAGGRYDYGTVYSATDAQIMPAAKLFLRSRRSSARTILE